MIVEPRDDVIVEPRDDVTIELLSELTKSIHSIFKHFNNDFDKINRLLVAMLACREQWLHYAVNHNLDALRLKLNESLEAVISDALTILVQQVELDRNFADLLPSICFAANNLAFAGTGENIDAWPSASAHDIPAWQQIADILLTKDGEWRKRLDKNCGFPTDAKVQKQRYIELLDNLKTNIDLQQTLHRVRALPDLNYYADNWPTVKDLLAVLRLLVAELRLQFGESNRVDFIEIACSALDALGTHEQPSDLLLSLDCRIQHLLIDEFQDTSALQFQLLERLTMGWQPKDGRTLFLVGDPMQSIYRFRQAEVGLFIKAWQEGIGSVALTPLRLTANFRSAPAVVEWVNQHFVHIFPQKSDIPSGAVAYVASSAVRTPADRENPAGVMLHPHFEDSVANEDVIRIIQTELDTPSVNSIAILVRSRKHAAAILPLLRAVRIPYQAVEIEQLVLRPIIQDLLALTKALLFPADRTAWLAILRAPWCGLTLQDLLTLTQTQPTGCLWPAVLNYKQQALSVIGQQILTRIVPILDVAVTQRFRYSLRQWIEHTWTALGGPACLEHYADMADCQAFFELLEKYEVAGGLSDFLNFENELAHCYSSRAAEEDARVSIMTIHKSKGLEFDVVILPALHEKPRHDDSDVLVWMDQPRGKHDNDLLLATRKAAGATQDKMYTFIRSQEKCKMNYENARVLYVATTRTRQQLHLVFTVEENKREQTFKKPAAESFLDLLWDEFEGTLPHLLAINISRRPAADISRRPAADISRRPAACPRDPEHVEDPWILRSSRGTTELEPHTAETYRLSTQWQLPAETHIPSGLAATQNKDYAFQYQPDIERRQGIVIHRLLQTIAIDKDNVWLNLSKAEKLSRITQLCLAEGLPSDTPSIATINTAINNVLHDTRGQWLFKQLQSDNAQVEYAINTMENDELKQFVLDATFIDEHGVRWIVDYKTAALSDEGLDFFLQQQREHYAIQLTNYANVLQKMEDRPIKLALYFPLLPAWVEWEH